jgi:TRAP-type transport system small permease protein
VAEPSTVDPERGSGLDAGQDSGRGPAQDSQDDEPEHGTTPSFQRSTVALRALARFENGLMFVVLAGTVVVILAQIFYRYALEQPLSWSNEVATDLLVYVAFIGFAIGVRDNAHVALHLFENRLGLKARRGLRIGELLVLGTVLACVGLGGAIYLSEQSDVVSPVGIPLWTAFLPLPFGSALGLVHIAVEIVALLRGADVPGAKTVDPDTSDEAPAVPPGGAA